MLKLGQLMLDRGRWKQERVLSESWVRESTARHHETSVPYPSAAEFGYGYQWWVISHRVADRRIDTVGGYGYGGQCITMVPEFDLVVVSNAGDYEGDRDRLHRMFRDFLLPAAAL
jgi:CubicO group peptidase (beta-lactamase class C family)